MSYNCAILGCKEKPMKLVTNTFSKGDVMRLIACEKHFEQIKHDDGYTTKIEDL